MEILTVVTAHTSRRNQAEQLCHDTDARMFLDDGTLGEPANTRRALRWAEGQDASHVIVLQDDALPVPDFTSLAAQAIAERPDHVISFYLGTGRPLEHRFAELVANAEASGARWIDTKRSYWGVAWSTPTRYLPDLNAWLANRDGPTDSVTGDWTRYTRTPCTHTWPCLVDHTDGPSLIHDRTERRKAWSLAAPPSGT